MKLVIEIPEEDYKRMIEQSMFGRADVWRKAIQNGTPLPKGHGRLIDADALLTSERPNGIADDVWKESHICKLLSNASTIIETDNEGSEE